MCNNWNFKSILILANRNEILPLVLICKIVLILQVSRFTWSALAWIVGTHYFCIAKTSQILILKCHFAYTIYMHVHTFTLQLHTQLAMNHWIIWLAISMYKNLWLVRYSQVYTYLQKILCWMLHTSKTLFSPPVFTYIYRLLRFILLRSKMTKITNLLVLSPKDPSFTILA